MNSLFGTRPGRSSLFDPLFRIDLPEGFPQRLPDPGTFAPEQVPPAQVAEEPKRHWGDKLGELGEFIMATSGNPAGIEATQMRFEANRAKEAARLAEQQYQRRRADDLADWQAQEDYKRLNPKPPAPNDTERDWDFYQRKLPPDQFEKWVANNIVDKPRLVMLPNGQWGQVGGYQGGGSSEPPAEAIAELRRDPSGAAEFDEIFGAGSAARILQGGATPGGSRNFLP